MEKKKSILHRLPIPVRQAVAATAATLVAPVIVGSFLVAAKRWSPAGNGQNKRLRFELPKGFPQVGQRLEVEVFWLRYQQGLGSACHSGSGGRHRTDPIELRSAQCTPLCRPVSRGDPGVVELDLPSDWSWRSKAKGLRLSLDTIAAGRALLTVSVRAGVRLITDSIDVRVARPVDDLQIAPLSSPAEIERARRFFGPGDEIPVPVRGPLRLLAPWHPVVVDASRFVVLATGGGAPTHAHVEVTLVRGPFTLHAWRFDERLNAISANDPPGAGVAFDLRATHAGEGLLRLKAGGVVRDVQLIARWPHDMS